MKKRLFRVMIFVVMVLCLGACSKKEEKKTVTLDDFTIPAPESREVVEETTEKEKKKTSDKKGKDLNEYGTVNGDTYENEFFGVKYVVPDGYQMMSAAELKQLQQTADSMGIENNTYSMYVMNDNGSSINATVGKLSSVISLETNFELALDAMKKSSQYAGWEIEVLDKYATKLYGNEGYVSELKMSYLGIAMKCSMYQMKVENKVLVFTAGCIEGFEAEKEELLAAITELK